MISLAGARDAILRAATTEFARAGFHGATMRDIAQKADVSQGLIHHHFGSKEGLWNAVGERASTEFLSYVAKAIDPAAVDEETIPNAVRTYMRYWREHPAAFRINLWRLLEGPTAERRSRSQMLTKRIIPLLKHAQSSGFVRDDMPVGLVLCVAGSLVQFWLHSQIELKDAIVLGGDEMPDDDAFVGHIMQLIRSPAPSSSRRSGTKPSKPRTRAR